MDTSEIKDLLERYWKCETSIEEERLLKSIFSQGGIPSDLSAYSSLFYLKSELAKVAVPDRLNEKLKKEFGREDLAKKKITAYFYPALRIAASVLIVVSAGIGFRTQYAQDKYMDELMSDTYTNPEDAVQDAREALGKVSSTLSKGQNFLLDENKSDSTLQKQNSISKE